MCKITNKNTKRKVSKKGKYFYIILHSSDGNFWCQRYSNCKFICHKRHFFVFNLNFEQIPNKNFIMKLTYSPVVYFNIHWEKCNCIESIAKPNKCKGQSKMCVRIIFICTMCLQYSSEKWTVRELFWWHNINFMKFSFD